MSNMTATEIPNTGYVIGGKLSNRYDPADALKEIAKESKRQLDLNHKQIAKLRQQRNALQADINILVAENERLEKAARRADPAPRTSRKKAEK